MLLSATKCVVICYSPIPKLAQLSSLCPGEMLASCSGLEILQSRRWRSRHQSDTGQEYMEDHNTVLHMALNFKKPTPCYLCNMSSFLMPFC